MQWHQTGQTYIHGRTGASAGKGNYKIPLHPCKPLKPQWVSSDLHWQVFPALVWEEMGRVASAKIRYIGASHNEGQSLHLIIPSSPPDFVPTCLPHHPTSYICRCRYRYRPSHLCSWPYADSQTVGESCATGAGSFMAVSAFRIALLWEPWVARDGLVH